jgi:hypothetical protein
MKILKTIILSRFKKPREEEETERRRGICKVCPFNSKNVHKIPLTKLVLKKLSDFYSWITGNADEDNLGSCLGCKSCSIYYKTEEGLEICPKEKW